MGVEQVLQHLLLIFKVNCGCWNYFSTATLHSFEVGIENFFQNLLITKQILTDFMKRNKSQGFVQLIRFWKKPTLWAFDSLDKICQAFFFQSRVLKKIKNTRLKGWRSKWDVAKPHTNLLLYQILNVGIEEALVHPQSIFKPFFLLFYRPNPTRILVKQVLGPKKQA